MQLPHFGAPSEIFTQPKKKIMKRWLQHGKNNFPTKTNAGYYFKIPRLFLLLFFSFLSIFAFSQQRITGKVSSGDTAIAGATVQVKNAKIATQTDAEGNLQSTLPQDQCLLLALLDLLHRKLK